MPSTVSRRQFLSAAAAGSAIVVGSHSTSARSISGDIPWAPGQAAAPDTSSEPLAYRFFTEAEVSFIEAAVSRLIPGDELGPGTVQAGVPYFLDRQLAGGYGRAQRWYMHGPWLEGSDSQGYQSRYTPAEEHTSLVRWAFDTTFRNSIRRRAADVQVPEALSPEMLSAGASSYKQMCQRCHAGPGVERAKWASGMRPKPPHLKDAAAERAAKEIFWLVKHGAKMTGMPAFGPTHDDQALWSIVAFVKELSAMTPERYAALGKASSGVGHSTSGTHRKQD